MAEIQMLTGLGRLLGIELISASAEEVVATMPVTPDHHQPYGFLHGGASVALAESVASIGGYHASGEGRAAFGMEINANHLRSVRDGLLTATGRPVHVGATSQVWQIDIRDDQQRLICVSRCTLAVIQPR